ncbi:hypothetical protein LTR08_000214 [Meristemomyces frigidus]|nr:hypothetical protein LTR08_000214 [Meristemomyces frigidus]
MASLPETPPAWGEGLFENENDLEVIRYLDREMGVNDLEHKANTATATGREKGTNDGVAALRYSVYAPSCSNKDAAEAVKKHLDAGALKLMCTKMVACYFNPLKPSDYTCHGHLAIILGACAMTLGCKLDGIPGYKMFFGSYSSFLGGIYEPAPLMDKAKGQMHKALYEVMIARVAAGITTPLHKEKFAGNGQGMMGGLPIGYKSARDSAKAPLVGMAMSMVGPCDKEDMGYGGHAGCAGQGCGRGQVVNGGGLLQCGKCGEVKYCSRECQKKDWRRHKVCCRTPEDTTEMKEERAKWMNMFYYDPK